MPQTPQTFKNGRALRFVLNCNVSLGLCGAELRALVRLVLIDKENRIRGDTAKFASRSRAWAAASARARNNLKDVATLAARLLDARLGKKGRSYRFSAFAPKAESDGYFIFDCGDRATNRPEPLSDNAEPEAAAAVMTACFYVGYVHRCR
ncbi:MAG: hypothetical protein ACR65U_08490 [Methylocystis sp.]